MIVPVVPPPDRKFGASPNLRVRPRCGIGHLTYITSTPVDGGTGTLGLDGLRRCLGQDGAGRASKQSARGDAELGKGAVEVGADGAVREVELLADLAVSEPGGRHARDLQLLSC